MLKKINAGQHEQVQGQMKRWTRAGGKVLKGLERRRKAEAALYELRRYSSTLSARCRFLARSNDSLIKVSFDGLLHGGWAR
jgi:hypothetical protein